MSKQAIGYTRVSTERQAKEGVSLEAQKAKIHEWCGFHGYDLVGIFTDEGVSGASMRKRPNLEHVLKVVRKDMALVTYSLSRLSRSTRDLLYIGDFLHNKGADLVSISENIDTTNAAGKMIFRILGVIGEFEKDIIGERTRMAMRTKKLKGEYCGGVPPYGYRLHNDKKTLIAIPEEQKIIAEVFKHKNYPFLQISKHLSNNGYLNRTGKPFEATQIKRIINFNTAGNDG